MKILVLLTISVFALADAEPKQGYERAIDRYNNQACTKAKAQARERYEIIAMDPGCRCEHTDSREWQCDVGFTYTEKKK
jgi:hypothetical protein